MPIAVARSPWLSAANLVSLFRLALAPILVALAYRHHESWFLACLCIALVSDIVDGKLARWLGQASELGARIDSWADFATYTTVPLCAYWLVPEVLADEAVYFWLIVASMILPKVYGFLKFRKLTCYHTRGAVAAAYVVGAATVLMFAGIAIWPFRIAAVLVVLPKLEEMAITTVLPEQVTMVRSLRVALRLRREILNRSPQAPPAR